MQAIIERAFERWTAQGEMRWLDELKRLAIEVICTTVIGMQPGEEMDQLRRDYATVLAASRASTCRPTSAQKAATPGRVFEIRLQAG